MMVDDVLSILPIHPQQRADPGVGATANRDYHAHVAVSFTSGQKLNPITHSSPIVSVTTAAAAAQAFLHTTESATLQRPRSRKQLADYYQRFTTTNSEIHFHSCDSHLGAGMHLGCIISAFVIT